MISALSLLVRSFRPMKFVLVISFNNGPKTQVDYITTKQNQIGFFGVYQIHPTRQFRLAVVIADMQVTGQNHRQGLLQGLIGDNRHLLAVLMVIMETAQS